MLEHPYNDIVSKGLRDCCTSRDHNVISQCDITNNRDISANPVNRVQLVILDEMGYVPFNKNGSELLFQLISDWYETKSVVITSNLEFSSWNKVFIDPRLTSALVDRLIHHAHILTFTGESFRLKNALSKKE